MQLVVELRAQIPPIEKRLVTRNPRKSCAASFVYKGSPGWYNLDIQCFDGSSGEVSLQTIDKQPAHTVLGCKHEPIVQYTERRYMTRGTVQTIALRPGDQIRIIGTPDGGDLAWLDYIEIEPLVTTPPR